MNRQNALSSQPSATLVADVELVTRCRTGDRQAWRALYDRHAPLVYRFISALGVPPEERDDAAQEVFIAVYRSLVHFRGEAQLSTWIYRIAARHAGRLGRRRKMREVLSAILLRQPVVAGPTDPSERLVQLHLVDQLLAKLSPKKRAVFVLFEIEGVPVEEIARIVGCPENTVWSRLHHARSEMLRLARKREQAEGGAPS